MLTLIVLVAVSVAAVQGGCQHGCNEPVSHYKEIGCKPVNKLLSCCPQHYDCSKFFAQESDKCYFQGNVYNIKEAIPGNITEVHCAASCYCSRGKWEDVRCANIECPELWGPLPIGPGCFHAYKLDGCCSHETVCPPFNNLATCEVDGKMYYEGEKFLPAGHKLSCVCKPNFEGKFEAPFCREISCGTELRDTAKMRRKCAPVYYGTSLNCPIQWECPREGDNIVPNQAGSTSDEKCYYGEQQLNIGDKLVLNRSVLSPKINCECSIPPLVTCKQTPHNQ